MGLAGAWVSPKRRYAENRFAAQMISLIDKIFIIAFARERRKSGVGMLESAWRRSTNVVYSYLGFFVVSIAGLIVVTKKIVASRGGAAALIDVKGTSTAVFVLTVISMFVLDRHFKKYLASPPDLPSQELPSDRRFLFWTRLISFGSFALACSVAVIVGKTSTE